MALFGQQTGASSSEASTYPAANVLTNLIVGNATGSGYPFRGKIDSLRVTKNVARYTGIFSPPTLEF
jgi:hypothetical protein